MVAINRIAFMGTPEFALPSLKALLDSGENVVCVVTQPDRPRGRGRKVMAPPVKELALAASLPVLQPERIRGEEFHGILRDFKPDIIVLVAFGKILPSSIITLPPLGTINVHGSLLPRYRGAAPIQWALVNGEEETGVTVMQMDEGIDTGDILLQESIAIMPQDTAGTLSAKLAELGGKTLVRALDLLRSDSIQPLQQDDARASYAPILQKEDGVVDWSQPAKRISGLIRGLDPWPATVTTLAGRRLRLFSPQVEENRSCCSTFPEPGTICRADRNGLLVTTGNGCLLIREVQPEGARRMEVAAFISGRLVEPGTLLGR
ncbi:MAG: methionyl-tRNA formyltransferase [Deltaproteobacteria bacterium]|jgi:methionyl-tRNA formyltransferase|nr:methionyl-tRNA formyltransferase [Deltaproteobacteria bacterium]